MINRTATADSTHPKGGFSCYKDCLADNGSVVFQIKFVVADSFMLQNRLLIVAANQYIQW